ncbi:MAG: hypothetical protein SGILL_009548 [Bacillariaceae sp.]
MTLDWMDFSVEHLSKWWGGLMYTTRSATTVNVPVMEHIESMLSTYIKAKVQPPESPTPLQDTIAMVAFAPYQKKMTKEQSIRFTSHSLAATIASLYQAGFGRVLIVGIQAEHVDYVQATVDILTNAYNTDGNDSTLAEVASYNSTEHLVNATVAKLGATQTEVAFVHITDPSYITTPNVKTNIPRAAVVGMRTAMMEKMNSTETTKWLGSSSNGWKYVYLTEPDTILHIRPSLLNSFRDALDSGLSLFPHRLHPHPHEIDLPDSSHSINPGRYLPNAGHFGNISTMDTSMESAGYDANEKVYTSCCDDGKHWPYLSVKTCGPWWGCTFKDINGEEFNETQLVERHGALQLYPMMQIRNGVGPVFGATNHGRRCYPSKTPCKEHSASPASTSTDSV